MSDVASAHCLRNQRADANRSRADPAARESGSRLETFTSCRAIANAGDAGGLGAVRAAIENTLVFNSVADDPAAAMRARGRENLDRTLEAVEDVVPAGMADRERLVVFVATQLASLHDQTPRNEPPRAATVV